MNSAVCRTRSSTLYIFCCFFLLFISTALAASRAHPWKTPQECKVTSQGYLCDNRGLLRPEDRVTANNALSKFNSGNQCGQCLAVTVQNYVKEVDVVSFAKALSKDWRPDFTNCKSLAVMAYGTVAKYVYWAPGEGSIMCDSYDDVVTPDVKKLFRENQPGRAIAKMADLFHNIYETRSKEGCDAARCRPTATLQELQKKMPDPFNSRNQNVCRSTGPVCDPDGVLTSSQRSALERTLQDSANSDCRACLAVGIIGNSAGEKGDLVRLGQKLRNAALTCQEVANGQRCRDDWSPTYQCNTLTVLLVVKPSSYANLMPHSQTPSCNKVGEVYASNVEKFRSGDTPGAIMGIAEGFNQVMKSAKDCRSDPCGRPTAGGELMKNQRTTKPATSGIGGFLKNQGLGIAKKVGWKKIAIPIIVLLCLAGLAMCCGCIFCREKTMGCLRGVGSMATKHGPGMMSKFGGGGAARGGGGLPPAGGVPTAEYSKGPQRDEVGFGGTYGPDGGGGGVGGGGGGWADDPNRDNKPQYDLGQGNRGWVGSKTMTGGGGGGF